MALSYTQITLVAGSGTNGIDNTEFTFAFPYLNTGDIKAIISLNPTADTPVWTAVLTNSGATGDFDANGIDATNSKIKLSATPAASSSAVADSAIRIFRSSTLDAIVDFQGGSRISEADLDTAYRQGLYAAQEAAEDAPASGGRSLQATDDVSNLAITTGKMAGTLDLSGKTLTIPVASVTAHATALRAHANMSLSSGYQGTLATSRGGTGSTATTYCNLTSNVTGVLPYANGGRASTVGQVIEEFLTPCDGVAVTLTGGDVTIANITAEQQLTTSYADVTGSSITYTPPAGTKTVVYRFTTHASGTGGDEVLTSFKLLMDEDGGAGFVEVADFRTIMAKAGFDAGRITWEWAFPIGGTPAVATTGRAATWTSDKTIKLTAREYSTAYDGVLHNTQYFDEGDGSVGPGDQFSRPLIGIRALG